MHVSKLLVAALVGLTAFATALDAKEVERGELDEVLAKGPKATYTSPKPPLALEYCLGRALSDYGIPSVLHGENVTVVSAYASMGLAPAMIVFAITIEPAGVQSSVVVRMKGKGFDEEAKAKIEACI